jgi:hypothetical protein
MRASIGGSLARPPGRQHRGRRDAAGGNLGGAVVVAALGALQHATGDLGAAGGLAVIIALLALTIPDPLRRPGRGDPVA